jgi:hypothetical protein
MRCPNCNGDGVTMQNYEDFVANSEFDPWACSEHCETCKGTGNIEFEDIDIGYGIWKCPVSGCNDVHMPSVLHCSCGFVRPNVHFHTD